MEEDLPPDGNIEVVSNIKSSGSNMDCENTNQGP